VGISPFCVKIEKDPGEQIYYEKTGEGKEYDLVEALLTKLFSPIILVIKREDIHEEYIRNQRCGEEIEKVEKVISEYAP
jgi:hypothetical protein